MECVDYIIYNVIINALAIGSALYLLYKANMKVDSCVKELIRLRADIKILNGRISQIEK